MEMVDAAPVGKDESESDSSEDSSDEESDSD